MKNKSLDEITRTACGHLKRIDLPLIANMNDQSWQELVVQGQTRAFIMQRSESSWEEYASHMGQKLKVGDNNCLHYGAYELACQSLSSDFFPSSEKELMNIMAQICQKIFVLAEESEKFDRYFVQRRKHYDQQVMQYAHESVARFITEAGDSWSKKWGKKEDFVTGWVDTLVDNHWVGRTYPAVVLDQTQRNMFIDQVIQSTRSLQDGIMKTERLQFLVGTCVRDFADFLGLTPTIPTCA